MSEQEEFDWCGRSAWTRGEPGPASTRSLQSEQLMSLLWEAPAQLAGISQHGLKNQLSLNITIAGETYTESGNEQLELAIAQQQQFVLIAWRMHFALLYS